MADPSPPFKVTQEEHRFPCETCGSDLRFDPQQGQLVCDHCGATQNMDAAIEFRPGAIAELDYRSALSKDLPEIELEETRVLQCPNCGAQVAFDANTHATECPFCATPVVTGTGTHRHIKPRGLLPFALTEKQARVEMTKWLGSLWFAPDGLKEYARKGRRLQGIYVPYWTFDADTKSRYSGQRGTVYYVTRTVQRDGKSVQQRVQKIRWNPVSGRVARWFDDVLVLASKSLPKKFTDALEPWDLAALEPYRPEYLAGFRAEGYTVEIAEGFTQAKHHIDRIITRDVKFDIGGDRQRIHDIDTQISDITFKHILLPVWLAAYKYHGKTFRFVVNGRTGRVQGERPWSRWKVFFAVLLVVLIAAAVGFTVAMNQ
ncbi:MAG: primosomal protein N' (replication factor Y) - superfamily II helicase [Paracoccaceae bacterium]